MKKGYNICVESWENDSDNYKTVNLSFIDLAYAQAVFDFLTLMKEDRGITGTYDVNIDAVVDVYNTIRTKHPDYVSKIFYDVLIPGDTKQNLRVVLDAYQDYVGYPSEGFDFPYVRVIDSIEVFYLEADPENQTEAFRKESAVN